LFPKSSVLVFNFKKNSDILINVFSLFETTAVFICHTTVTTSFNGRVERTRKGEPKNFTFTVTLPKAKLKGKNKKGVYGIQTLVG